MALSDDLRKLSERAKEAEDHAAAAKAEARANVEQRMSEVKASAETAATELRVKAEAAKTEASAHGTTCSETGRPTLTACVPISTARRPRLGPRTPRCPLDWAESDADLAISLAYAAIEEADYAVLQALLARREADEAAGVLAR